MKTLNKIQILGRSGVEPEIRRDGNQEEYVVLSLATHSYHHSTGEETTQWHRVRVYGDDRERAKTLAKGSRCYVEGVMIPVEMERAGKVYHDMEIYSDRLITNI